MNYIHHDFYSNFSNSMKYGDRDTAYDLLINEISDLVSREHAKLNELFKIVDVKIPTKPADTFYINTIIKNAGEKKMLRGIAFLIAEKNGIANEKNKKQIDGIYKNLEILFTKLSNDKQFGEEFTSELFARIEYKNELNPDRKVVGSTAVVSPENKKKAFKIVFFIFLVATITYLLVKPKKKQEAENTGENSGENPQQAAVGCEVAQLGLQQNQNTIPMAPEPALMNNNINNGQGTNISGTGIPQFGTAQTAAV